MVPAGYLYKRVQERPDWLADPRVHDIHSVSACLSDAFADYVGHWRHNACWLFDAPESMHDIAKLEGCDLTGTTLFYYEVYEQAFDETTRTWLPIVLDGGLPAVEAPQRARLRGYDVVTFSQGNMPECSPLSCNGLSPQVAANAHSLFATFEAAREALESGVFDQSEPGPFRVFAVYTADDS